MSRAKDNAISKLQEEFNTAFYQSYQDPENSTLYDTMLQINWELND